MSLESLETNKVVKKWGGSLVIVLNKDEVSILKLQKGDIIELKVKPLRRGGQR